MLDQMAPSVDSSNICLISSSPINKQTKYGSVCATVASKLVSDTMREVKREKQKDGMKAMQAKVDRLEKDLRLSTSQPETFSQKGNLSFQGGGGAGSEKAKDIINVFMKTEFVGNHMFRDLMVPKIARMEKKDE